MSTRRAAAAQAEAEPTQVVNRHHLQKITLKDFKSYAGDHVIPFVEGLTCVIGPNGSGAREKR